MSEPIWTDGYADNLPAAAIDALEWLLLMQRIAANGRWRFSQTDSSKLLDGCIEQLRKHLEIGETISEVAALRELADSEGTRAVNYLRRARKAEAQLAAVTAPPQLIKGAP